MRRASLRRQTASDQHLLVQLGFAHFGEEDDYGLRAFVITDEGRAFDDAANVYGDSGEARLLLREAYSRTPATQALMQGLHGRGPVPVAGALHLLARHRLADPDNATGFRGMLSVLNAMGVVSYSNKHQTVKIVAPMPQEDGEKTEPTVRVIEPDRPYQNIRNLRETLRACRDYIWWAEPHFTKKMFEPLHDEADATKVTSIRILTGPPQSQNDVTDYKRFNAEMQTLGISVEWRTVETRDRRWHDRYMITRGKAWNVPPTNTLFKGDYSEIASTKAPPFEAWWNQATPVAG